MGPVLSSHIFSSVLLRYRFLLFLWIRAVELAGGGLGCELQSMNGVFKGQPESGSGVCMLEKS